MHVVNNTASSDSNTWGRVVSSLKVLAAADIMDVSVIMQVQHPDVAALEVRPNPALEWGGGSAFKAKSGLGAPPGCMSSTMVLRDSGWCRQPLYHPCGHGVQGFKGLQCDCRRWKATPCCSFWQLFITFPVESCGLHQPGESPATKGTHGVTCFARPPACR